MKKDGKFMVGSDIPEGQAAVIALLDECFEIAYELRTDAEDRSDTEKDATDDVNGESSKD